MLSFPGGTGRKLSLCDEVLALLLKGVVDGAQRVAEALALAAFKLVEEFAEL